MLTHPTASRAKAPRRRLPTTMLNKDAVCIVLHEIISIVQVYVSLAIFFSSLFRNPWEGC